MDQENVLIESTKNLLRRKMQAEKGTKNLPATPFATRGK
jgi:hypothetical protein